MNAYYDAFNRETEKRLLLEKEMGIKDKQRKQAMIDDAKQSELLIRNGDIQGAMSLLSDRAQLSSQSGGNPRETMEVYNSLRAGRPEEALQMITNFRQLFDEGYQAGGSDLPAQTVSFNKMVQAAGLSREEAVEAAKINLGLKPRATGSAMQTIASSPEALNAVAAAEAVITGKREEAKLIQQMQLEPQIQAAITSSVAQASNLAKQAEENRSNSSAWNVYKTGMGGLVSALGDTSTGSVIGLMPAWASNQKIADGAIAIMRPIIKDVVRSAGEGTFTDQDQKLVDMMIPSRTDDPKATQAKVLMLDNFIKAKLNIDQNTSLFGEQSQQPVAGASNPQALTPEEQAELEALEAEFGGR